MKQTEETNVAITDSRLYNIIMSATRRIEDEIERQEDSLSTYEFEARRELGKIRKEVKSVETLLERLHNEGVSAQ